MTVDLLTAAQMAVEDHAELLKGKPGERGIQGPRGEQGPQGTQGPIGPEGPQGIAGDSGPTGPKGEKGDKGDKGDAGEKGDIGPAGPPGRAVYSGGGGGGAPIGIYDEHVYVGQATGIDAVGSGVVAAINSHGVAVLTVSGGGAGTPAAYINPPAATPEAICLALIAAGLMEAS